MDHLLTSTVMVISAAPEVGIDNAQLIKHCVSSLERFSFARMMMHYTEMGGRKGANIMHNIFNKTDIVRNHTNLECFTSRKCMDLVFGFL